MAGMDRAVCRCEAVFVRSCNCNRACTWTMRRGSDNDSETASRTFQLPMSHLMCNKAVLWPEQIVAHMLPLQEPVQHVMIVNQ
jgi:hypothetical protein